MSDCQPESSESASLWVISLAGQSLEVSVKVEAKKGLDELGVEGGVWRPAG